MTRESFLTVDDPSLSAPQLVPVLTKQDRCDRCGVEAQSVVILDVPEPPNVLLLCGHHTNKYEPSLVGQGATIYRKQDTQ